MVQRGNEQPLQCGSADSLSRPQRDVAHLLESLAFQQSIGIGQASAVLEDELHAIVERKQTTNVAGLRIAKPMACQPG